MGSHHVRHISPAVTAVLASYAKKTARRKAIYLLLHSETAHGGDRSEASRQVGDLGAGSETERFAAATATLTGQSERSVQRDVEHGEKVIWEVMDMVRGTPSRQTTTK